VGDRAAANHGVTMAAKLDPRSTRPGLPGLCAALLLAAGCATASQATTQKAPPARATPRRDAGPAWQVGLASYYADSLHGRKTASGQPYDRNAATCAHRTHPFGTVLRVELVEDGRAVECRVNDRGPFVRGRIVDLSRRLAEELGLIERGVAKVRIAPVR